MSYPCIISRGVVDQLSTFDIEYLFLNVRGKSVGEQIQVIVTCPDDGETKVETLIDIDSIKVVRDDHHSRDIELGGDLKLDKYPSLQQFVKVTSVRQTLSDQGFDVIASCEEVYNEEESWNAIRLHQKRTNRMGRWSHICTIQKVEEFFTSMPS